MLNKHLRNSLLRLFGVVYGRKAFAPPLTVELILLHNCNLNCVTCVIHSDSVRKFSHKWKILKQDPEVLTHVIHELADMGVERIVINAHGEPFLYPPLIKLVKLIKERGMKCCIITNGTLITNRIIKKLSDLRVDLLRVSLWAGDAATYINVHPNQTEKTFYKIKKWMLYLKRMKEDTGIIYPRVLIVNPILNKNYNNIPRMIDFAQETGVNSVEFRVAHLSVPGLSKFSLHKKQKYRILSVIKSLKYSVKNVNINFEEFQKQVAYDWKSVQRMDRGLPLVIPCYVGWYSSRIDVGGYVRPCAGCYSHSFGNILKKSFKDIWFSSEYNQFRKFAKQQPKGKGGYFKQFTCETNCCNSPVNIYVYNKLHPWKRI